MPFLDVGILGDFHQFGRIGCDAMRGHFVQQKINLGLHEDALVQLMLMLHSVNCINNRSSIARHSLYLSTDTAR